MTDWDDIVAAHGPSVWRMAYRLTGHAHDADECLQDVFLSALKVSRREPVRNWPALLKRSAANWAIDRLRRRARHAGRDCGSGELLAELSATTPRPDQVAQAHELSDRLRIALGQLPKRQARVFCLCCIEGWPHSQTADALGLETSHVTVLLHRSRKRLRELLAPAITGQGQAEVS
ncbi:MAG: sigma-70 family RNA polymerase sigma factor [bacterium]|nr:sigma-70 family RNA polymerase sigma factor [bacterium]